MGFAGNLSTLPVGEVLQIIQRNRGTGVLRIASPERGRDVLVKNGEIIGVTCRQGEERQTFVHRLVSMGKIDAATAAQCLPPHIEAGGDSIDALIKKNILDETSLLDAIRLQVEDDIIDLGTWEYADFIFQDVGPKNPKISALVERVAERKLSVGISGIVMESARRQDDWQQIKGEAPADREVIGVAVGREEDFARRGSEYPESAVIMLIDAVRSTADIIRDSVLTRLDVLTILISLKRDGLISSLTREDILSHAEWQMEQQQYIIASRLYCHALYDHPNDKAVHARLEQALDTLGDIPEAAGCYSQLALGWLADGNIQAAESAARRAISLEPQEPQSSLILVRCLLDGDKKNQAIAELHNLVTHFLRLGQLEDARSTCLKILDIDAGNVQARKAMARIFSSAERDDDSEDVAVCSSCGHANEPDAASCAGCGVNLRLTCTNCNGVVAASDRICVFCGADPHAGQRRAALVSPGTAKIKRDGAKKMVAQVISEAVDDDSVDSVRNSGVQGIKARMDVMMGEGRDHQRAGRLAQALASFREVARFKVDDPQLLQRIRDLEGRCHQNFVEEEIVKGHTFRGSRHFWRSLRCYKRAYNSLSEDDSRKPHLEELITATRRVHIRACAVYGSAVLLLLIMVGLIILPYVHHHRYISELALCDQRIDEWKQQKPADVISSYADLDAKLIVLDGLAQRVRSDERAQAQTGVQGLRDRVENERITSAHAIIKTSRAALEQKHDAAAEQELVSLGDMASRSPFNQSVAEIRGLIKVQRERAADIERQRNEAPKVFAAAQEYEANNQLNLALAGYRAVAALNIERISEEALKSVQQLSQRETAFNATWQAITDTALKDMVTAQKMCDGIASQAPMWGREEDLQVRRKEFQKRLDAGAEAWKPLTASHDAVVLEKFVKEYANVPQAGRARDRLLSLRQEHQLREGQREAYHQSLAAHQYEDAWNKAHVLESYGESVPFPLVIECIPVGSEVSIGNVVQGKTPCVLQLRTDQIGQLTIAHAGWKSVSRTIKEAVSEWRWQTSLARKEMWHVEMGKQPINSMSHHDGGGFLIQAGDSLVSLDHQGQKRWQSDLGTADDIAGTDQARFSFAPAVFDDGSLALGLRTGGLILLDSLGHKTGQWDTHGRIRGQPALYRNDILSGNQQRLAVAADALWCGPVSAAPSLQIACSSPALAGPVVVIKDADRIIIVATERGFLQAFEESSRRMMWEYDLQSGQIGQFMLVGDDQGIVVTNDNIISSYEFTSTKAVLQWSRSLAATISGNVVVAEKSLWMAAGSAVYQLTLAGAQVSSLGVSAPVVTAPAVFANTVAVGCRDRSLVVFQNGKRVWTTPCESMPAVVSCTVDSVIVGMQDGTLAAYAP